MVHELALTCARDQVSPVSDALEALEALSISVEDADALSDAEQPLFGEPGMAPPREGWNSSRLTALFATHDDAEQAARLLLPQDFFAGCELLGIRELADQDWVSLTQSQFAPVSITPTFWIVPTWHEPPADAREIIRLDPGMAFGTGTHPTTFMCLQWIARDRSAHVLGRVLDYGCGSGILGIAAAKHGATHVDAVDIDPTAVEAAARNAQANEVSDRSQGRPKNDRTPSGGQPKAGLGARIMRCGTPEMAEGRYDIVLANILATPLRVLAPLLCARLAPGGRLVLAGILERQADELIAAYAPYLKIAVAQQREGWILMTGAA